MLKQNVTSSALGEARTHHIKGETKMNKRDTEIEVILDLDELPKGIGTYTPSGKVRFSEEDVEDILNWAENKIDTEYPISVFVCGFCPHFIYAPLHHLIEVYSVEGNVVRYDFAPLNAPRFTIFDNTGEVMA
jgi:hypothetical protein